MSENKFADLTFSTPGLEDRDAIRQWLCENFYPDEPVSMSFDFLGKTGFVDRGVQEATLQDNVDNVIDKPQSVMAKDAQGNIVGRRPLSSFSRRFIPEHSTPFQA